MTHYVIVISQPVLSKAQAYLDNLVKQRLQPGAYLAQALQGKSLTSLSSQHLLEALMNTKQPQIYAESEVQGDGSDWNQTELSLLGDINIAVPVTVFDDGIHRGASVHPAPFQGTLLFTPGALLRNDRGTLSADSAELLTVQQSLNDTQLYQLYLRRLLPLFLYANQTAKAQGKQAFITIPGIGCGLFAGKFRGQMGAKLEAVLEKLLTTYATVLTHIQAVYYDPYQECANRRVKINAQLDFMVRPLMQQGKPQLCPPEAYEEAEDNFKDCLFFSMVAWDPVSWPGNDYYAGFRQTDDGVKAAATDTMYQMTGIAGHYNAARQCYLPPSPYRNWEQVVTKNAIALQVADRLQVFTLPEAGQLSPIQEDNTSVLRYSL